MGESSKDVYCIETHLFLKMTGELFQSFHRFIACSRPRRWPKNIRRHKASETLVSVFQRSVKKLGCTTSGFRCIGVGILSVGKESVRILCHALGKVRMQIQRPKNG